ncbi:hypothetical protein EON65_49150 [archaeon]|nr:MAG: hypothetical protein EON65_49150 [archaeon]
MRAYNTLPSQTKPPYSVVLMHMEINIYYIQKLAQVNEGHVSVQTDYTKRNWYGQKHVGM